MTILVIDAAGAQAAVALADQDGALLAEAFVDGRPGLIETLPVLMARILDGVAVSAVAVTLGPGSFTGLRTALSLAAGFGAAAGVPVWGVAAHEVFAQAFPALARPLWVAIRARKGRLFLIRDGVAGGFDDADVPRARGTVAVAGDAAHEVAARLAAQGADVLLTDARRVRPVWVARAALARQAAGLEPAPLVPIYVDPPEAKLPAGGLRPAPV